MLISSPTSVRFGSLMLDGALRIIVSRTAVERLEAFHQTGPFCVFADVTRQRTSIRVERTAEDASWPLMPELTLSHQAELSFHAAIGHSDAGLVRISSTALLVAVEYRLDANPALQVLDFLCVSDLGDTDPLSASTSARLMA